MHHQWGTTLPSSSSHMDGAFHDVIVLIWFLFKRIELSAHRWWIVPFLWVVWFIIIVIIIFIKQLLFGIAATIHKNVRYFFFVNTAIVTMNLSDLSSSYSCFREDFCFDFEQRCVCVCEWSCVCVWMEWMGYFSIYIPLSEGGHMLSC